MDKQLIDNHSNTMIHYEHSETDKHGDYRINNQGNLEYYTEGYWQEVPWLNKYK